MEVLNKQSLFLSSILLLYTSRNFELNTPAGWCILGLVGGTLKRAHLFKRSFGAEHDTAKAFKVAFVDSRSEYTNAIYKMISVSRLLRLSYANYLSRCCMQSMLQQSSLSQKTLSLS